jgi:hypothetical protein
MYPEGREVVAKIKKKNDVKPNKVAEIVQSYITEDDATEVTAKQNPSGTTWTVTATLPD